MLEMKTRAINEEIKRHLCTLFIKKNYIEELEKIIRDVETSLLKLCGYRIKIVERAGINDPSILMGKISKK